MEKDELLARQESHFQGLGGSQQLGSSARKYCREILDENLFNEIVEPEFTDGQIEAAHREEHELNDDKELQSVTITGHKLESVGDSDVDSDSSSDAGDVAGLTLDDELENIVPEWAVDYRVPLADIYVRFTYHGGPQMADLLEWLIEVYFRMDSISENFDQLRHKWITVVLSTSRRYGGCTHSEPVHNPTKSFQLFNLVEYHRRTGAMIRSVAHDMKRRTL